MELHQLRAFLAVARQGQLVRAAEQIHLTQSALSKQIKSLEDELGVLLFVRNPSGMAATAAGRRLQPLAVHALDAVQEIGTVAASLRGTVSGPLRLGTIIDPESIRLGALLAAMVQFYPQVDVSLSHGISGGVLQMLRAHEVDACFFLGVVKDPDIAVRQLLMEHYVVIGPPGWEERLRTAGWPELAAMPWMATPFGSSQHGLATQMFAERGLSYRTVVQADQEASMLELVHTGVALGLMRERALTQALATRHVVAWPGVRLRCPLSLLYRRADEESATVQALLSSLHEIWPESEPD
ncbi:LysR family transcriptional regulator [Pseudorhodoferax sp. Leaf267]|uniref:LysR family transcriptional regulator n=1 Tax=Pseudorhodoferax sp. Leaf267 TaxID=1736316 RepID=UPI0006F2DECD|nr:LysR family transcriptional regulator [Pseudorhodoferax sp. Leaf267]KQP12670.1 LysR family transcriptional regulator [Pseudorhodoferax sp. Leaf267]